MVNLVNALKSKILKRMWSAIGVNCDFTGFLICDHRYLWFLNLTLNSVSKSHFEFCYIYPTCSRADGRIGEGDIPIKDCLAF